MTTTTKIMLALIAALVGTFFLGGSAPYLVFNPSATAWGVAAIAFCAIAASLIKFRGYLASFANGDAENAELHSAVSSWEQHAQRLEVRLAAVARPADVLPADVEELRAALGADVEAVARAAASALERVREFHPLIAALGAGAAQMTAERDRLRDELAIVDEAHARRKGARRDLDAARIVGGIEDEIGRYAKAVQRSTAPSVIQGGLSRLAASTALNGSGGHPRVLDAPEIAPGSPLAGPSGEPAA